MLAAQPPPMPALRLRHLPLLLGPLALNSCVTPEAPSAPRLAHPLHVLYLGQFENKGKGADYSYLPGQTLAPEAIYFDHPLSAEALTESYVRNFDAVVDASKPIAPKAPYTSDELTRTLALETYAKSGRPVLRLTSPATDAQLREQLLAAVSPAAKAAWETFLATREPVRREARDASIANYEKRPSPVPYQFPLTPEGSMARTQVPADFELKLFAAEPDIAKPIALAWDERGRLWIAESRDYPHHPAPGGGHDSIKICEDTDGDGRADKFTVFADGLSIPTSLVFANGGLIVAQAPHFLFFQDTDGDDKADVRKVLFENCWSTEDTHAGPSSLTYGLDNWIYGAVGYAGFKGKVGGKDIAFDSGVYRFKPDASEIHFLHQFSNNTWGFGMNDYGDIFGSTANNAPSFHGTLPAYLIPQGKRLLSANRINTTDRLHPNTPNVRQVDVMGGWTAAAGHTFTSGLGLPPRLRGKALVCEPTAKLVSVFDVRQKGSTYEAVDNFNLVASSDEWFSPVFADVGPDGAVWVADWCEFIIQHNPTPTSERGGYQGETGGGGAHVNPNRDGQRGRVYRVVWKDAPKPAITSLEWPHMERRHTNFMNKYVPNPQLNFKTSTWTPAVPSNVSPDEYNDFWQQRDSQLVQALKSENKFWRLTAQRLILERKDCIPHEIEGANIYPEIAHAADGINVYQQEVSEKEKIFTLHVLSILHCSEINGGYSWGDHGYYLLPATSANPAMRRNHIRLLNSNWLNNEEIETFPNVRDPDLLTRLAAFNKLSEFRTSPELKSLITQLRQIPENRADRWLNESLQLAAYVHGVKGYTEGPNLLAERGGFEQTDAWSVVRSDPNVTATFDTPGAARSGNKSLKITLPKEVWSRHIVKTPVAVQPRTDYRLSAWVKGDTEGDVQLSLGNLPNTMRGAADNPDTWTEAELFFNSGDLTSVDVQIGITDWPGGTVRVDDVSLTQVTYGEGEKPQPGDAARGKEIFQKNALANCVNCHALKGIGGVVGPALDGVASRHNEAYLRQSLLEPSAQLAPGFEQLKVSPMPAMGQVLREQEINDVVAFLLTLK